MTPKKPDLRLIFALLGVAIIWGTTFLGIRVAVNTIPPWFVTAMRQGLASTILLIYLVKQKQLKWIGWPHFGRQVILALLMIVIANGLTTVAEKNISSGLASLLSSLSPLLVFIGGLAFGTQKPSFKGILGVILGLLGVIFIFRNGLQDFMEPAYKQGITIMFVAVFGWSAGTIYIKKHTHKSPNIFLDLFYQFAFSAVVQLILALIFSGDANPSDWSSSSLLAVVYLGVFGSVLAFFCYHYALKRVSAIQASVLNYFNTIIAIILGWLILDEVITIDTFIAAFLIIAGVFITNYNRTGVK